LPPPSITASKLSQLTRPQADEAVKDRCAHELHCIAGQEHRHIVTFVHRGARNQESESGPGGVLRPVGNMNQEVGHR
jgi:hypothetical protein